jgi:hypothetical protein
MSKLAKILLALTLTGAVMLLAGRSLAGKPP